MGQIVPAETYVELDAKIEEIKRQLRQPSGYPFSADDLAEHLQAAVEGRFQATAEFDIAAYELVEFMRDGEFSVPGEVMLARARKANASTGFREAEMFLANQEKIPASWRKFYLVFPEARVVDGDRRLAYLYWDGGCWCLDRGLVAGDWDRRVRLVRRRA